MTHPVRPSLRSYLELYDPGSGDSPEWGEIIRFYQTGRIQLRSQLAPPGVAGCRVFPGAEIDP